MNSQDSGFSLSKTAFTLSRGGFTPLFSRYVGLGSVMGICGDITGAGGVCGVVGVGWLLLVDGSA